MGELPDNPTFSTKRNYAGESFCKKIIQRAGFSGGTQRAARAQASGRSLVAPLKFGSNLVVKLHQIWTNPQIRARPVFVWDSMVLLRKTKEKAARMGDNFSESLFLVLNEAKVVHPFSLDSCATQRLEVQRWRDILAVPYANYKSMLVPR